MPLQAHERVAVLDGHALGVVGQDEGADAALVALALGHLGHDHDDVGDGAVGGPQLVAVDGVAPAVLGGGRGGAQAGRGPSPRRARSAGRRRRGRRPPWAATRASAPRSRTASAARPRRSTGGRRAAWRARRARCRPSSARGCSRPATGRGPPYSSGTFMPSAPISLRPSSTSSGILASRSICERVDLLLQECRAGWPGSARPSRPSPRRAWAGGGSGPAGSPP